MKQSKKLLSLALALVMGLTLAAPAMAVDKAVQVPVHDGVYIAGLKVGPEVLHHLIGAKGKVFCKFFPARSCIFSGLLLQS